MARYAAAFVQIVDHFRDRVRVFETFNEPNNWRDSVSKRPAVSPLYYAKELQQIYLSTKYDNGRAGDPCAQVRIVSGALFSSEDTDAADYWNAVVDAGRNTLAWDWMHEHVGSWPYDGVGYHIYVGQSAAATTSSVATATQANLDAIWAAVTARDDQAAGKQLWLTELGWTIDQVSAQQQSEFLDGGVRHRRRQQQRRRRLLVHLSGLPGRPLRPLRRRRARRRAPPPRVRRVWRRRRRAPSGARRALRRRRRARDAGAGRDARRDPDACATPAPRLWSEADGERLGAAPGCPSAAATNALVFLPTSGGYANSPADARVTLAADTPPGGDASFTFAVTAPATPGDYVFAARMVRDGVGWFGDTFRTTIHVDAAGGRRRLGRQCRRRQRRGRQRRRPGYAPRMQCRIRHRRPRLQRQFVTAARAVGRPVYNFPRGARNH